MFTPQAAQAGTRPKSVPRARPTACLPRAPPPHRPVHDDRALELPVLCHVLQVEADGQLEVELHSGALVLAAQRVVHRDVNLRACRQYVGAGG
jgi:hypothetical protein